MTLRKTLGSLSLIYKTLRYRAAKITKRKSAVELLQESKAFYVKSEIVLDRKQELKNSTHLQVTSPALDSGLYLRGSKKHGNAWSPKTPEADTKHVHQLLIGSCGRYTNPSLSNGNPPLPKTPQSAPPLPPKSPCLTLSAQRRSGSHHSAGSDQLQTKLRRLLNTTDSKENVFFSESERRYERRDDHVDGTKTVTANDRRHLDVEVAHTSDASPRGSFDRTRSVCRVHHKSLPDLHARPASDTSSSASSESNVRYEARSIGSSRRQDSCRSTMGEASSTISSGEYTHRSRSDSVFSRVHTIHQSAPAPRQHEISDSRISVASIKRQVVNRRSSNESSGTKIQSQFQQRKQSLDSHEHQHMPPICRKIEKSLIYANGSGSENISPPPEFRMNDNEMGKRRPILRSKSDISHRYSKVVVPLHERTSIQSPGELDRFFEQLGLNNSDYRSLSAPQSGSSSPVFFSSVSSIDSAMAWTPWSSCMVGPESGVSLNTRNLEQPSIIERNARIIKWLCNCRKAQLASARPR